MSREGYLGQMLSPIGPKGQDVDSDAGFTMLELSIVMVVMMIILGIASGALLSLSQATNRNEGLVSQEQAASQSVTQMVHDLRSAHSISIPNGASSSNEVLIQENQASGGTTQVEWMYQPASGSTLGTLTRYAQTSGGSLQPSGSLVSGIVNPSTKPLLSYYDDSGGVISNTANIGNCTTRVTIDLVVAPPKSAGPGGGNFEITQDVAITDQLAILTQPGSVQC